MRTIRDDKLERGACRVKISMSGVEKFTMLPKFVAESDERGRERGTGGSRGDTRHRTMAILT
jgi:hypothetical protein